MELHVRDKKLRAALDDEGQCKRRYGTDMAKKIKLRRDALYAAESLAVFWPPNSGPERCHELRGDLAGIFSVDLKQPYRLLFQPIEDVPSANRSDELARWKGITAIEILTVEDTHG